MDHCAVGSYCKITGRTVQSAKRGAGRGWKKEEVRRKHMEEEEHWSALHINIYVFSYVEVQDMVWYGMVVCGT
jgi:hypothetical protein